jgi:signal transduction histidine kinase
MRLRTRYLLSLLAVGAVMAAPALFGAHQVERLRSIALDLRREAAGTLVATGRLSRELADVDRLLRSYVATAEPDVGHQVERRIQVIDNQIDSLRAYGYGPLVDEKDLPVAALRVTTDSIRAMVERADLEGATALLAAAALPVLDRIDQGILALSDAIGRETSRRVIAAERIAAATATTTYGALILAFLVFGLLAWLAARLLSDPLDRLRQIMGSAAEGQPQTAADPAFHREDEIGELFRSFHAMTVRLAELDRMKAEFVGIASHDLKTPIDVITGYAELIGEAEARLDPGHRDVLRSLQQQARALGDRVNQLIEISRMESRSLRLGLEEINVRHFATSLGKQFGPNAARQGVYLHMSVARSTPRFIVADPDCLRSDVLGNVLAHAIKFSPQGGTVHVEFRGHAGRLLVEIRDPGPPLPMDEAIHLFDRYFRGPSVSGRVGSGMGLPIARAGVEAHGGRIAVESLDHGVCFLLDLPLRPVTADGAAPLVRAR